MIEPGNAIRMLIRLLLLGCLLLALLVSDVLYAEPSPPAEEGCDVEPGVGYTQSISGVVDGDELQIRVSDRFGGAVESLTWRGMEFINIWDHGRQISYAWSMNNYGECLNPTEPGSGRDYQGPTSTSKLLSVCKPAANILTTTTQPAFWLAPGESGYCSGGATTAINESPISDQILEKTMQIGYEGLDNVVVFDAQITNPVDYDFMRIEIPTGYLTGAFTSYYYLNPQSGELTTPETEPLVPPWAFNSFGPYPPILATPDGRFAMGTYYPGPKPVAYYGIYRADAPEPANLTNKWHIVVEEDPYPAGTYAYRSFAVVGTLEAVRETMMALYALHPVDFNLPMGYVDLANCNEIAGWAWDADRLDEPIEVALYEVDGAGGERLVTTVEASIFRSDLVSALGDNGRHGFSVPTPLELQDGESHTIRVDALNPAAGLPGGTLLPVAHEISCAAVEQPTDPPPPGPTAEEVAAAATEPAASPAAVTDEPLSPTAAPEADASQPVCGLALVILGAAVFSTRWRPGRRKRG